MDPEGGPTLQSDIAEQITHLLQCEATIRALRIVSREWKALATSRIRTLKPRAGQRGGALDLALLAERFPHVETLDLRSVSGLVRDECLASSTRMPKLRTIVLEGCKNVTNDGLRSLNTSIQSLSLRNCSQITWPGLQQLANLPHLTSLNIAGIKINTNTPANANANANANIHAPPPAAAAAAAAAGDAGGGGEAASAPVPALASLLQRLESLTVGDSMALSFIADRLVVEELAAARPPRLTHLDLSGCIDLTDWAVQEVCSSMPSLTSLSLQSCVRLTNASLLECGRLSHLRSLNLRGCLQLNDAGLGAGLSALTSLSELNLQGCTAITGACLYDMSGCKSLAVLNLAHCGALSSLEPLRALPGLERLSVSHCGKLGLAQIMALTALRRLTEVRASHLRNPAPLPPPAAEQLSSLSRLDRLQSLDLSYFSNPGGFPLGLLDAVADLTRLTRLSLAGCGGPSLAAAVKEEGQSGLGFLERLSKLEELDLGSWQEVDPQELSCLAGATALRRLVVSRLGNRHANACFEGCDCNGSPLSSLCPSLCSSPGLASPDSAASAAGGPCTEAMTAAAAAAAAAEARAAAAARGAAVAAALEAAAAAVAAAQSGVMQQGGSRDISYGGSDVASAASTLPYDGPALYDTASSQPSTARYQPDGAEAGCSSRSLSCPGDHPSAAACAAAAGSTVVPCLDSLTRQMAAVGISCLCTGRCSCSGVAATVGAPCAAAAATAAALAAAQAASGAHTHAVAVQEASLEQALATVLPVRAPVPASMYDMEEASYGVSGLPPMPMTPRPGLDGALGHLTGLTALAEIHLEACNHVTDVGVSSLARLPRLELLDLGGCNRVTGRTLGAFATHGSLHTLLMANCASLNDAGVAAASKVTSLRVLDVSGCGRLTDAGTVTLGSLRRMSRLSLRGNSKCSDRTVEVLAALPALQWLSLSLCGSITDASLTPLSACRSLTWLDVSHCWRLSRTAVRQLEAERTQLKVIYTGRH